jgi:hypothetical protein
VTARLRLSRSQIELYCHGLADLVLEPPHASSCAVDEVEDIVAAFRAAEWNHGTGNGSAAAAVPDIAQHLLALARPWFAPAADERPADESRRMREALLGEIERLREAALGPASANH